MRRMGFLAAITVAAACVEATPVEPPDDVAPLLAASAAPASGTSYTFHASLDVSCGVAQGCSSGSSRVTPSGVLHGKGVTIRLILTGGLTGEFWVSFGYNINLRNGKGVGSGTVLFELASPGAGTFECTAHAGLEGYMPPAFAFVEHTRYAGCQGSGDFAGMRMMVRMTNEANPGLGEYEGVAQIW